MSKEKKKFKEKIVQLYETLFTCTDIQSLVDNEPYWNEFFLLKANTKAIDEMLDKLEEEELKKHKNLFNLILTKSVLTLKCDSYIRIANSLVTLLTFCKSLLKRIQLESSELMDFLFGDKDLNIKLEILSNKLCGLLLMEIPLSMKSVVLKIYSTLLTYTSDINKNPFIEYFMSDLLFDALIDLLANPQTRQLQGYQVIILITIITNFRKNKTTSNLQNSQNVNPFTVRLSIVDNEVALDGYARVISTSLLEFTKKFYETREETPSSLLASLTSLVGNMFVPEECEEECEHLRPNDSVLLAFYEVSHLNRNFITLLTNSQTEIGDGASSASQNSEVNDNLQNIPSNLLVNFFEFCSIVMLQSKDVVSTDTSRLCFIILTCISEDQCANAIMHDINIVFKVQLHRMPMRHRKISDESGKPLRPLSYSVLDLMVEFISTHLRKNFPYDLYILCLGVIHRVLCYQKKCKIRFNYTWRILWYSLINLLKFIVNNESELIKKWNIFILAHLVINVFNLFITFGDTFLPSAQTYDDLYYEIIRMHIVFDNLYSFALRYGAMDGVPYKEHSAKLASSLVNIKAIINHFNSKIDSWSVSHQIASLTEDQVLEVVRSNYDTLTLKLHDGLDQYENYSSEKLKESPFFNKLLQRVIYDHKTNHTNITVQEQQTLIKDVLSFTA